ncbi:hypothetical protein J6R97_04515 [bacterium]|nr:hypothetical protein [bacterium]
MTINVEKNFASVNTNNANMAVSGKKDKDKKETIFFAEFDKGGEGAKANDGKLTGYEVKRARWAGYDRIVDGITAKDIKKNPERGYRNTEMFTGTISRAVANNTHNSFLNTISFFADGCILPLEMAADWVRVLGNW